MGRQEALPHVLEERSCGQWGFGEQKSVGSGEESDRHSLVGSDRSGWGTGVQSGEGKAPV